MIQPFEATLQSASSLGVGSPTEQPSVPPKLARTAAVTTATAPPVRSGIAPLDERVGGLEAGGTYLVVGAPGPAKMVAALQILHEGIVHGERCLLLTNADVDSILGVARAWGFELEPAWESGLLQVVGFRDDFELRAIRSIAPEEVLEELDEIVVGAPARIAVDPGSLFLTGGARTLLGSAFMAWARKQPGTVVATFPVDGDATDLPSAADWLLTTTTARLVLTRRSEGLYQIRMSKAVLGFGEREEAVTLELKPGAGLVRPDSFPTRRDADRGAVDRNRLLLVSLDGAHAIDLQAWANHTFEADVVSQPFEAVTKVQASDANHGCVLVYAARRQVRDAVQACRALRPLTRAAIVFASDDAIRSTDRVHLLEAGADDCLSGGLDFRELGVRIKQAIASGARPAVAATPPAPVLVPEGGLLSLEVFAGELGRREADPDLAFFCLLDVRVGDAGARELEDALVELVRSEEGDVVAGTDDRCLVLLQGAREGQLGPFLDRVRARLGEGIEVGVLSHPTDGERIRALLETARGERD